MLVGRHGHRSGASEGRLEDHGHAGHRIAPPASGKLRLKHFGERHRDRRARGVPPVAWIVVGIPAEIVNVPLCPEASPAACACAVYVPACAIVRAAKVASPVASAVALAGEARTTEAASNTMLTCTPA